MKAKRIIFLIITIIWMITVFMFSNESATDSSNTSDGVLQVVLQISPKLKQKVNSDKKLFDIATTIIRKLAHFSLYTLGGILIYNFINTFNIKIVQKVVYSIIIGGGYSITDEIHQIFIEGRSCELKDMLIDTSGVITGILIFIAISKLINKCKKKIIE